MLIDNIPLEPVEYEFILCKPDGTQLCMLEDIYDVEYEAKFPTTDQLKFTVPYYINRNGQQVINPNFDKVKGKYLVLMNRKLGEHTQLSKYFIVQNPTYVDNEKSIKEIYCYSREHELNKKIVRGYNFVSRKLYSVTNEKDENGEHVGVFNYINELTNWTIDVDSFTNNSDLLLKFRSFDVSEKSLFDFIITDVQSAFDCVFLFDTINRKISVTTFEKMNSNRGFYISEDNYMKSISQEIKIDEVVPRLYAYGANDISINSVTLTGVDYIDDFSYFMTTDYMSQGLIDALNDYEVLIQENETKHVELTSNLKQLRDDYSKLELELFHLMNGDTDSLGNHIHGLTELKHIKDLRIKGGEDLTEINQQIFNKELEVLNKQAQIDHELIDEEILANHPTFDYSGIVSKQSEIDTKLDEIKQFNNLISIDNNFTGEQISELNDYIEQGTYSNSSCETAEDLYEEAQKELKRRSTPPLEFSIDSVDFLNIVNGAKVDKRKLVLGDIVTINLKRFSKDLEVRLIGYTHGIDNNSLSLRFSNKSSMENSFEFLAELQKEAKTTTVSLNMSKPKIDRFEKTESEVSKFINGSLDAAKNRVLGGKNQDVQVDEFGIWGREKLPDGTFNPKQIRILNNIIAITDDNWNTVKTVMDGSGVIGDTIIGKIIAGENLIITTGNGDFTVDVSGVTIKGTSLNIIANDGISNLVDYWNSVEQKAKDYTNQEVGEVDVALTELSNSFTEAFSDSTITSIEANVLKNNLEQVKKESTDLVNIATSLSIATEKDSYSTALTTLETEINKWINQPSYPLTVTATDRTNINAKFSDVQDKKSILINKIAIVRENNATSVANAAQESANQAQADADTANSKLSDIASDSKLTPSEKQAIQKEWDIIISEKTTLETQADLYGVVTEKSTYATAYNNLETYIVPLLTDLTATSDIVGSTFRSNFKDYYDARTALLNKVANVTKALADNSVQKDETINGVKIDTTDGLTVARGDNKVRSLFNATEGIKIQYRTDTLEEWNSSHDKLYIDTDGNLIANNINANGGVFSGTVTASNFTMSGGTFDTADIIGGTITGSVIQTSYDNNKTIKLSGGELISQNNLSKIILSTEGDSQSEYPSMLYYYNDIWKFYSYYNSSDDTIYEYATGNYRLETMSNKNIQIMSDDYILLSSLNGISAYTNGDIDFRPNGGKLYYFNDEVATESYTSSSISSRFNSKYIRMGLDASSNASDAVAIGSFATANGLSSTAIGFLAGTDADNSIAIGSGAVAYNTDEGTLGNSSTSWTVAGDFSVSGTKNFEISHPHPDKKATHKLRHSAVESPTEGDTLYRYAIEALVDNETVELQLPDYFQYLNKNIDVWVNGHGHFGRAFGEVAGNKLFVTCEKVGQYKVLVIGTRNDDHPSIQNWHIKGVEREIGESWLGETYTFEVDEITEVNEITEGGV